MSNLEKKIFNIPHRVEKLLNKELANVDKDGNFVTGYGFLRNRFFDYFTSSIDDPNEPEVRWVDYHFAVDYAPAQLALKDLTANLFNNAAMRTLTQKLAKAGALTNNTEYAPFYLWHTDPKNWSDMSYQARSVKYFNRPQLEGPEHDFLPAQY